MVKVRVPMTVHDGKTYVPPGTEVEMDEKEAKRFIDRFGEYGGANLPQDPSNTQVLNILDAESIEGLNTAALIHGGHGKDGETLISQREERQAHQTVGEDGVVKVGGVRSAADLPSDADLEAMNKSELIALAQSRNVPLEHGATKADIIDALKK